MTTSRAVVWNVGLVIPLATCFSFEVLLNDSCLIDLNVFVTYSGTSKHKRLVFEKKIEFYFYYLPSDHGQTTIRQQAYKTVNTENFLFRSMSILDVFENNVSITQRITKWTWKCSSLPTGIESTARNAQLPSGQCSCWAWCCQIFFEACSEQIAFRYESAENGSVSTCRHFSNGTRRYCWRGVTVR